MPICTYLKHVGAPSISLNSWGAKSESVSTKDTRDAYDKNIHFISKEKEIWFCQGSPVRSVQQTSLSWQTPKTTVHHSIEHHTSTNLLR